MAGIEDARMEDLPPAADATPEQLAALQLAPADSGGAAGDAGKEKKKDKEKRKKAPPSSSSSSSSSESESDSESDSSSESESTDSDDDRRKKKKRSKRSKHSSKKKSSKGGALALLAALKDHPDAYAWCSDYVATRKDLDLATVLKAFTKRFSFEKRSRDHKDKINGNKKGNGDNRKGKANDDAKRRRSNDATAPTGVGSRAASDPDGLSAVNINDRFLTNWQWAHAKKFGKCINCWKTGHRNKDCKESAAEPPVRPTA